jgi:hypothetical protein
MLIAFKFAWRTIVFGFKHRRKIIGTGKTYHIGDLRYGVAFMYQQIFGFFEATVQNIIGNAATKQGFHLAV